MRNVARLAALLCLSACAQTTAKRVAYDDAAEGFRVYDPLPILVVTCQHVQVVSIPDLSRGYAVTFDAVLAKNDSSIKVTDGMLTEAAVNIDDSTPLSLLQGWGEKALGGAKDLAALGAQVPGTIPGMEGVWLLDVDASGKVTGLRRIKEGGPCPGQNAPASATAPKPPGKFPPK